MKASIPRQFADMTAALEDLHSLAVEGQRGDNSPDMQRVLASHLRKGVALLDTSLVGIVRSLGDFHA